MRGGSTSARGYRRGGSSRFDSFLRGGLHGGMVLGTQIIQGLDQRFPKARHTFRGVARRNYLLSGKFDEQLQGSTRCFADISSPHPDPLPEAEGICLLPLLPGKGKDEVIKIFSELLRRDTREGRHYPFMAEVLAPRLEMLGLHVTTS